MYRSRLQSLENRRNLRQIFLLGTGLVFLIIVLVSFGMPVLTRLAIFISTLRSSAQKVDKADIIPPAPPDFIKNFNATNSANQVLSGYAETGSTVYLTHNAKSFGNVVVNEDRKFLFEIKLEIGPNVFKATSINQAGNKSFESNEYTIAYSNKSPKLSLESPINNQVVHGPPFRVGIKGVVEDATRLAVNNKTLVVTNGKFDAVLEVSEGENTLDFSAWDQFGNQTKRQLTITAKP